MKKRKSKAAAAATLPEPEYHFDYACAFGNIASTDVDSITVKIEQKAIASDMPKAFAKLWRYFAYRTVEVVLVSGQDAHDDIPGQMVSEHTEILCIITETHSIRLSGRTKLSITLTMKELSDLNVLTLRRLKNTNGRIKGKSLEQIPVKTPGRKKKEPTADPYQSQFDDAD